MKTFSIITAIAVFFLASVSICEGYMSLNFNLRKRNQRHSLPVSNTNQTPRSVNSRIQQIIPQLQKIFGAGLIATISTSTMANAENDIKGFQTKSGLKYYDLLQGTSGMSPKYGQFVSFNYICYYRSFGADGKLEVVDSRYEYIIKNLSLLPHIHLWCVAFSLLSPKGPFLHKHGNGRVIRAIDEGLHTMVPGGRRRIVVPKSIGYTDFGLGGSDDRLSHFNPSLYITVYPSIGKRLTLILILGSITSTLCSAYS